MNTDLQGKSARPAVSYVVLSFNSEKHLDRCLASLLAQAEDDEVWVVENGSTDGSAGLLRTLSAATPRLRTIFCERNLGTTVSRNLALRQVSSPYVAIVDSDTQTPPGAVDTLVRHMAADRSCGVIAPRLVYPDGRPQLSVDQFPTLARKWQRYVALRAIERRMIEAGQSSTAAPVDYAISAFWLMRRDLLTRVGYLDEHIFYSPEDVDYCIRVWQAGLRVVYDPSVTVIHSAQEISRGFPLRRATVSHVSGLAYLFRKHRYGVFRDRPEGIPLALKTGP